VADDDNAARDTSGESRILPELGGQSSELVERTDRIHPPGVTATPAPEPPAVPVQ